jgi:hypothetical protein
VSGYVYLIGSHLYRWYKIGKSNTPKIRIKDIGILLPFKIEVIAVWRTERDAYLESMLHAKYRNNHINGEWFHFDPIEIKALILDVPYTMVQFQSLTDFVNMKEDYIRTKPRSPKTPEDKKWGEAHRAAWAEVQKIESKEERKKAAEKLISERRVHKLLLIQKRHSA